MVPQGVLGSDNVEVCKCDHRTCWLDYRINAQYSKRPLITVPVSYGAFLSAPFAFLADFRDSDHLVKMSPSRVATNCAQSTHGSGSVCSHHRSYSRFRDPCFYPDT